MLIAMPKIVGEVVALIFGGYKNADTGIALREPLYARTLRKAREQVKCMVADGLSARQIRNYLARWSQWWQNTTTIWSTNKLIQWFCKACWDLTPAVYTAGLLLRRQRITHPLALHSARRT